MVDIEKAKEDPASEFSTPHDVLHDKALSTHEKIDILERWAYDAREMAVAEEENMQGGNDTHHILLEEIQECLLTLRVDDTKGHESPPTKHG